VFRKLSIPIQLVGSSAGSLQDEETLPYFNGPGASVELRRLVESSFVAPASIGALLVDGAKHGPRARRRGSGFGGPGPLPRPYAGEEFLSLLHLVAAAVVGIVLLAATRGRLGLHARTASAKTNSVANSVP
jgi:hypothetical protein